MKVLISIVIALLVVGCGESPTVEIVDPILEKAIRKAAGKPEGELTKADLEKVTRLTASLEDKQLTEVPKGLEKLTQLKFLSLKFNRLTDVKGLEKLTKLNILGFEDNKLTNVKGLEKLTQLNFPRETAPTARHIPPASRTRTDATCPLVPARMQARHIDWPNSSYSFSSPSNEKNNPKYLVCKGPNS